MCPSQNCNKLSTRSTSDIRANSKLSIAALQTNFHALRLPESMGIGFDVSFQLQLEQWLNFINRRKETIVFPKKSHSTNLIEKFVNILASAAKREQQRTNRLTKAPLHHHWYQQAHGHG